MSKIILFKIDDEKLLIDDTKNKILDSTSSKDLSKKVFSIFKGIKSPLKDYYGYNSIILNFVKQLNEGRNPPFISESEKINQVLDMDKTFSFYPDIKDLSFYKRQPVNTNKNFILLINHLINVSNVNGKLLSKTGEVNIYDNSDWNNKIKLLIKQSFDEIDNINQKGKSFKLYKHKINLNSKKSKRNLKDITSLDKRKK